MESALKKVPKVIGFTQNEMQSAITEYAQPSASHNMSLKTTIRQSKSHEIKETIKYS